MDKLNNKVRILERKNNGQQAENEKSMKKLERENQQMKERLDSITHMNFNLQRKLNMSKRKAD